MIYDKIENMGLYFNGVKNFDKVENAYKEFCENPIQNGRLDIDGDNVWCNVASYTLDGDAELKYEAHRAYADVQVMFEGEENFAWANIDECTVTQDFEDGGDAAFMTSENGQLFSLKNGYFAVFFPQDAHAPCRKSPNSDTAHKLVFKVKL